MGKLEDLKNEYKKYADEKNIALNYNEKIADAIINALIKNEEEYGARYCPCRKITGNKEDDKKIICPCVYHLDEINTFAHCHCNLFVKKKLNSE